MLSSSKKKEIKSRPVQYQAPVTRYYRATYSCLDGTHDVEVFSERNIDMARTYAAQPENARGRQLSDIQEFEELVDALTH